MIEHKVLAVPYDYESAESHQLSVPLYNVELLQRDFWFIVKHVLKVSFVLSSGRQYAQFCDLVIIAALAKELGIVVDWDVLNSPEAVETVRAWKLPPWHTVKPYRTEGLVAGVHEFWWLMLGDAFRWIYDDSFVLPGKHDIIARFEACGVPLGVTSSTTIEEISSLTEAVQSLRGAKGASVDELAMQSLQWHLLVSLHWLSHKRPRRDRGDVYADRWRDAMAIAITIPEDKRSIYDHLLVRQVQALDRLVDMHSDELARHGLTYTQTLYDKAAKLYIEVHLD